MASRPEAPRRVLGDFLRAQRARLSPTSLGLPIGTRRRTPGLRREELAQACGMSATWYTWLEQGRDVSASPTTLARLAGALRLTAAERAYLFELAGKRDPNAPPALSASDGMDVPPALAQALAAIDAPAYLLDRAWNARAWNQAAARLFVGWLDRSADRNLLRYIFLNPIAPTVIPDWESRARRVLAEFRAESSRHLDDPALGALVQDLRRRSPRFARWWTEHAVGERAGGERRFVHPRDGRLTYEQIAFTLASRSDFTLVILVAQAKPDRGRGARGRKARRRPPAR
jgi:transcriptional regulator with XRE-family HTH domain